MVLHEGDVLFVIRLLIDPLVQEGEMATNSFRLKKFKDHEIVDAGGKGGGMSGFNLAVWCGLRKMDQVGMT